MELSEADSSLLNIWWKEGRKMLPVLSIGVPLEVRMLAVSAADIVIVDSVCGDIGRDAAATTRNLA